MGLNRSGSLKRCKLIKMRPVVNSSTSALIHSMKSVNNNDPVSDIARESVLSAQLPVQLHYSDVIVMLRARVESVLGDL